MAVNISPAFKSRMNPFLSQSMSFRRKGGQVKTKKIQRKIKLKFRHLLFSYVLVIGFFFTLHKVYLFLISWKGLDIQRVEVTCPQPELREEIQLFFRQKSLGNILLLDIDTLKENLAEHRLIKEVSLRKALPPLLRVEIKVRIPAAAIKKDFFYLIDQEGVVLRKAEPEECSSYPLFLDSYGFQQDYQDKLALAWACLENLGPAEREQIEAFDLTSYNNVKVRLQDSSTWLFLGYDHFSERFQSFQTNLAKLDELGPLDYIDLRFENRLIIKPAQRAEESSIAGSNKEAN